MPWTWQARPSVGSGHVAPARPPSLVKPDTKTWRNLQRATPSVRAHACHYFTPASQVRKHLSHSTSCLIKQHRTIRTGASLIAPPPLENTFPDSSVQHWAKIPENEVQIFEANGISHQTWTTIAQTIFFFFIPIFFSFKQPNLYWSGSNLWNQRWRQDFSCGSKFKHDHSSPKSKAQIWRGKKAPFLQQQISRKSHHCHINHQLPFHSILSIGTSHHMSHTHTHTRTRVLPPVPQQPVWTPVCVCAWYKQVWGTHAGKKKKHTDTNGPRGER